MHFTQRQWILMAVFAVFWTVFMVAWSGDYKIARIAILFVIGCVIAFAWGFAMKRFGGWQDRT